jgi:pimeloyl-ACP methyl ester carboxylesterase
MIAFLLLLLSATFLAAETRAQWFVWSTWDAKYSERRGPQSADGLLVYLHGRTPGNLDTLPIPGVFVQMARTARWDILRVNRLPHIDAHWEDDGLLKFLSAEIERARRDGYGRVIIAGHSRGGWLALSAASLSSVDGVIGLAPGTLDFTAESLKESSLMWQRDELARRLLAAEAKRIAVFFFDGDPFDQIAEGRAAATRRALQATASSFLIVERPPALKGHMAAWERNFSRDYADCLLRFMRAAVSVGENQCGVPRG